MRKQKSSLGYENWLVWYRREDAEDRYFRVFEKNPDGSVTEWCRNFGTTGFLKPDVQVKPVTTKKEREWVDHVKRMIQRGMELTDIQYMLMRAQRDLGKDTQ